MGGLISSRQTRHTRYVRVANNNQNDQSNHQTFISNSHILEDRESSIKFNEAIFSVDQEHIKRKNNKHWILCDENLVECPICLEMKTLNTIIIPCGHAGICSDCLVKLNDSLDLRIKRRRDKPVFIKLMQTQIVLNCPHCRTQGGVFKMHLI